MSYKQDSKSVINIVNKLKIKRLVILHKKTVVLSIEKSGIIKYNKIRNILK